MSTNQGIEQLQFGATASLLALALTLGGGQGWLGDTGCQLLALVVVGIGVWRHLHDPTARWPWFGWLVVVPLLVPLLQLMPVPEVLWNLPAARRGLAAELMEAGVAAPGRWSLVPSATERAMWWLLPGIAMYLASLQLRANHRRSLLLILVVWSAFSVVLGLAQLAGGEESSLRFYTITNRIEAVGFFANRNHFACLLAATLPLVVVGTTVWHRRRGDDGQAPIVSILIGIGLVALLVLGLAMARSRAGLVLGMLVVLLSVPLSLKLSQGRRGSRRILAAAFAIGMLLSVQFALFGIMQRLARDPLEDGRFKFAVVAAQVAREQAPLGTGLGGFRAAYETAETPPAGRSYVNHAHNDYLELWLEAGWAGLLAAVILGIAFLAAGASSLRQLFSQHGGELGGFRTAAWLSLLVPVLHSFADYPLRTTTLLAVVGLLAAVMAPARNAGSAGILVE